MTKKVMSDEDAGAGELAGADADEDVGAGELVAKQFDCVRSHGPAPDAQMLEHQNWFELVPRSQMPKLVLHQAAGTAPVRLLPSRTLS